MDHEKAQFIYDEIADNVKANIFEINKVLSNCSIESKFATNSTEKKFRKILSLSSENIMKNEAISEYYDLSKVNIILEMLDSMKSCDGYRRRLMRVDSLSSLHSTSTEDEGDNITEMMNQLKEMRELLSAIWNTSIYDSNLEEIRIAETERQNKLFEIVFYIQKLARELITIASANKEKKKELPESTLDSQLIEKLSKLYKCLSNILELEQNKNFTTNASRHSDDKLETSAILTAIVEALAKHTF